MNKVKRLSISLIAMFFVSALALNIIHAPKAQAVADTVYSDADQIDLTGDDEISDLNNLPFNFVFYGQTATSYRVTTNGTMSMYDSEEQYLGDISVLNDDLYMFGDAKSVYTKVIGTPPHQQFVIQWTNLTHCCDPYYPVGTFQLILSQSFDNIQMQYLYQGVGNLGDGSQAKIGVQDNNGHEEIFTDHTGVSVLSPRMAIELIPLNGTTYVYNEEASYLPVYLTLPTVPAAPTLTSPANGATNIAQNGTFTWAAAAQATSYEIFFSTDSDFSNYHHIKDEYIDNGTSYQVDTNDITLLPNTTYYWQVEAINEDGLTMSTETRSFTTAPAVTHNISTCDQLQAIDQSGTIYDNYNLTQDISCDSIESFHPLYKESLFGFAGTFNGHGHTISDLNIDNDNDQNGGLFAQTGPGAVFENLTLHNGQLINSHDYSGALIGIANNTNITNVHSDINVDTGYNYTGGLVGEYYCVDQFDCTVQYSSATGNVNGADDSGGLIGFVANEESNLVIKRSHATGDVSADDNNSAGGLIGHIDNFTYDIGFDATTLVSDTYADGGDISTGRNAGGLVGLVSSNNDDDVANANVTIERSYSSGTATAVYDIAGGLIGYAGDNGADGESININDSFATTVVDPGDGEGHGFIGYLDPDALNVVLTHDFYDWTASDANSTCWPEEVSDQCTGIEGNSEFKGNSTNNPYQLDSQIWDFTTVWQVREGTYPGLRGVTVDDRTSIDLTSAESGAAIRLSETGCLNIASTSTEKESDQYYQDVAYDYTAGFVGFTLTGCETGGIANITLVFVGEFDLSNVVVRKSTTLSYTTLTSANSGLSLSKTTLGGKNALQVSYHITDGGQFDHDGVANATIIDPVGIGSLKITAPNTGFGGANR